MLRNVFLLSFILLSLKEVKGQLTKNVVFFTDKNSSVYSLSNPAAYLSARAIERRTKYNIAVDSTDLPVVQKYIDSVLKAGAVTLLGRSRWLNAIIIQTNDASALTKINSFPFVKKTNGIALRKLSNTTQQDKFISATTNTILNKTEQILADTFNYNASSTQIKIHKGEFLHNIGARGKGMQIAFLDAGYTGYSTNHFFDSARARNQFLGAWDFVQNEYNVEDHSHGLACFSAVAAYIPGTFVGSCPEAGYYLLRTEDAPTEQIIEEYNWALGAEYADSSGTDVISSSLGYTTFDNATFNHTYADMDGNTTVAAQMADLAAKKGMLVVNAMGNDGSNSWHYINTPADGDSVLAVGAVDGTGLIASFSSYGPNSDGQIKPNVVSVGAGTAVSTTSGTVAYSNGTSFACPNMAGLATCLWQIFPEVNNWKIITTLQRSSDKYTTPNAQYGYGLPNMKKAVGLLLTDLATMNVTITNCITTIAWSSKDLKTMRYNIERQLPGEASFTMIKTIAANGAIFSSQQYSIADTITSGNSGTVNYRIKQVIDTSAAGYDEYIIQSESATTGACFLLSTSNIQTEKLIELYPNPAKASIILKFTDQNSMNNLQIEIISMTGQRLFAESYNKLAGISTHTIPVQFLSKGKYNVVVLQKGKRYVVKEFIKQ